MTPPKVLLTVPQVVARLAESGVDVTEETIREWARSRKIGRVRLPSGRYRFRPEDVEAILDPEHAA